MTELREVTAGHKPLSVKPLFIWNAAGVWLLLFANIDLMKQISSAHPARFGSKSLTHAPDFPCCRNG